jgi:hypothetical protein
MYTSDSGGRRYQRHNGSPVELSGGGKQAESPGLGTIVYVDSDGLFEV